MTEQTPASLRRLSAYAESFAGAFRRRDQARWIGVYLQGLLGPGERKNVETMARTVTLPPGLEVDDLAQALQNFVNQSPWDEQQLWRRYRRLIAPRLAGADGTLVIDDIGFPKQGRRSVGVQRQYWSARGKKVNCQLAVAVSHVGAGSAFPLALRLYLPRVWLNDAPRLDAAGVPPAFRAARSKAGVALDLVDEVRAEGLPVRVVVAPAGYGGSREFREGLAERRLPYLLGVPGDLPVLPCPGAPAVPAAVWARRIGASGGLVWPGPEWGAGDGPLVLYAEEGGRQVQYALGALPGGTAPGALWRCRRQAAELYQTLCDRLGLDHFEGRSWRGFHHHACLVALAYGFLLTEGAESPAELAVNACG